MRPRSDPREPVSCRQLLRQRLARIEGQVRGISRMVDQERPCAEVLTQLTAVKQALRRVSHEVLSNHLQSCVQEALASGEPDADRRISDEITELMFKYGR